MLLVDFPQGSYREGLARFWVDYLGTLPGHELAQGEQPALQQQVLLFRKVTCKLSQYGLKEVLWFSQLH